MKGENYEYLEYCINRRRCCYSRRGIDNKKDEIVKPTRHFQ